MYTERQKQNKKQTKKKTGTSLNIYTERVIFNEHYQILLTKRG